MKSYEELKDLASDYIKEKFKSECYISDPIFRLEDDKLVLAYDIYEFSGDYNYVNKPDKWFIQDIRSGDVIAFYNISEKPYTKTLLEDKYINFGSSTLFDDNNTVILSFTKWQEQVKEQLKNNLNKADDLVHKSKVLKIGDLFVSPYDYLMANLEDVFDKMRDILLDTGSLISKAASENINNLFNKIRDNYLDNKLINKELIREYINAINYSWPDYVEITNATCNIDGVIDEDYTKELIAMREAKLSKIENI